jgi:large subunit ribosomal protein L13
MIKMIVDAKDLVAGRLATVVAKRALLGEKIDIVNSEKAVIIGKKKAIFAKYERKRRMGDAKKGPFLHRSPERIMKRIIRGMLPYKQAKGKNAFKNIKCHLGVPKKFENEKIETIKEANINFKKASDFLTLKDISKYLGKEII